MSFKSRAIGIIAGTAVALSIASGALAGDAEDPTEGTNIELINGEPCAIGEIEVETPINFGTWTWNGSAYELPEPPSGRLLIPITNAVWGVEACDLSVFVTDLETSLGYDGPFISGMQVAVSVNGGPNILQEGKSEGTASIMQNTTAELTVTINMAGIGVQPDTYTGIISFGISAGS